MLNLFLPQDLLLPLTGGFFPEIFVCVVPVLSLIFPGTLKSKQHPTSLLHLINTTVFPQITYHYLK